jgi:hypothetical protein
MMSTRALFGSLALMVVTAGPAAAGPVVVNDEAIIIRVQIPSIVEGEAGIDESQSTATSPFNATLDRTLSQSDQTNHAFASEDSSFGNAGDTFTASATGATRYSATGVTGIVQSDSQFSLQFVVLNDARTFHVSGSGMFPDTSAGASDFQVSLIHNEAAGPGDTVFSFTKADFNPANEDGAMITAPFDLSGTLSPGGYQLDARSVVSGGTNINEVAASYQMTFTSTAQDNTNGGGGTPIPLPAGVAPGSLLLAALAARSLRKRRRAAI